MRIYVYPGSFDPITNGHLDIIERASRLCEKLIVAVGSNESKRPSFTAEERINLIKKVVGERKNIEVTSFSGLLIDFMKKADAKVIIKGLRALSDFEYEFQMALLNKYMTSEIETLFMMTGVNYSYLSSSAVKEIARNGGKIEGLVPEAVRKDIENRLAQTNIR